jgi:hypothetical protein
MRLRIAKIPASPELGIGTEKTAQKRTTQFTRENISQQFENVRNIESRAKSSLLPAYSDFEKCVKLP